MKHIQIDGKRRLRDEPGTGHNRFHPDLPPIVVVDEGEEVVLDTRDGVDGQLGPSTAESNIASMEAGAVHPLTGRSSSRVPSLAI
jgi:formamidase